MNHAAALLIALAAALSGNVAMPPKSDAATVAPVAVSTTYGE